MTQGKKKLVTLLFAALLGMFLVSGTYAQTSGTSRSGTAAQNSGTSVQSNGMPWAGEHGEGLGVQQDSNPSANEPAGTSSSTDPSNSTADSGS